MIVVMHQQTDYVLTTLCVYACVHVCVHACVCVCECMFACVLELVVGDILHVSSLVLLYIHRNCVNY